MSNVFFFRIIVLASILSFGLVSCKKKEEITPERRIQGRWQLTSYTTVTGAITVDLYALQQTCDKDDFYELLENKEAFIDEGAVKCNPNEQQRTKIGNWSITADGSSFSLPITVGNQTITTLTFTVLKLTDTRIELQQVSNGTTTTMVLVKI